LSSLLLGGAETDILEVGEGNDTLTGGESGDFVSGGQGSDSIHLTSDFSSSDIYSYKLADLEVGVIDTFFGTMDARPLFAVGDDIIDIEDVIDLDNGVAARDEISDFISKSPDGLGGLNYLIDLDGGGATFSPVVFQHFVQFQVPVWFQADNEQQGI
jgi:Ca2+-binding RTX toxin-like protein